MSTTSASAHVIPTKSQYPVWKTLLCASAALIIFFWLFPGQITETFYRDVSSGFRDKPAIRGPGVEVRLESKSLIGRLGLEERSKTLVHLMQNGGWRPLGVQTGDYQQQAARHWAEDASYDGSTHCLVLITIVSSDRAEIMRTCDNGHGGPGTGPSINPEQWEINLPEIQTGFLRALQDLEEKYNYPYGRFSWTKR